ncbi:hypothetical protein QN277_007589 [Acacia crassicarpa]|uniref:Uncharacterized protein n=1 Tax=Acacia crassicarpa TaxID=499986 RepID=A0AAE1IWJ0_9FABA|nr:hypothetical protein QN277_007589 [Acacia crassicarpa]
MFVLDAYFGLGMCDRFLTLLLLVEVDFVCLLAISLKLKELIFSNPQASVMLLCLFCSQAPAGGWLARVYMEEFGMSHISLLLTLGTPHLVSSENLTATSTSL